MSTVLRETRAGIAFVVKETFGGQGLFWKNLCIVAMGHYRAEKLKPTSLADNAGPQNVKKRQNTSPREGDFITFGTAKTAYLVALESKANAAGLQISPRQA
jgi:hypothetical protein